MLILTITITDGPLKGQELLFDEPGIIRFGRDVDCDVCLTNEDLSASRQHFEVEVAGQQVQVRDVGSLVGTWVNGQMIGKREPNQEAEQVAGQHFGQAALNDGDEIRAGKHLMRVKIKKEKEKEKEIPVDPNFATTVMDDADYDPQKALQQMIEELGFTSVEVLPYFSDYQIERKLGKGGFGLVYQVLDREQSPSKRVALKIMLARVAVKPRMRTYFKREIEVAKGLEHPNIVRLFKDHSEGRIFYFTMEYCGGGNMEQLRRTRGGKVSFAEFAPLMRQILAGLSHVHRKGFVHRDLKPANILLTAASGNLVAKISDFGLAKGFIEAGLSGVSKTTDRAGTLPFMSKEHIISTKYATPADDVWSIAASFYQILTGRYPRELKPGEDYADLLSNDYVIPIRQHEPTIPQAVADVIDHALQSEADKRYRSAGFMLKALDGLL